MDVAKRDFNMGNTKNKMTPEERLDELMDDIIGAICLAAHVTPEMLTTWEHRGTIHRIRASCEAITGIRRCADAGPWVMDPDDETIRSHDFKHDAYLKVYGDFWDTADKAAYMSALTDKLNSTI